MANIYPLFGALPVVPLADLQSATSEVNKKGDTRKGGDSLGKKKGLKIVVDMTSGVYREVIALGSAATDKWQTVDGGTQYTPS